LPSSVRRRAWGTGGADIAAVDRRGGGGLSWCRGPGEQGTEAETAQLLGCTEGTVEPAAARGLRLRGLAGPEPAGVPVSTMTRP
jgi:hypothetical protein